MTGNDTVRVYNNTSAKVCYVALILVDRAFGGHEEGGWYYDTSEVIQQQAVHSREERERVIAKLQAEQSNEGRYEVSSVLSEGRYAIVVSKKKVRNYPEVRPHYE